MTEASTNSFRTAKPRFHLYTIQEILRLPPFDWLVQGILESDCVGVIYGPSGGGKTFTALDWALSVASGQNWQGRKVNAGPVVYVVAEGQKNVRTRIKAWMKVHGVESVDDAALVLEAPQLLRRDDVEALLGQIQAWNKFPQLIVLDTFSQCFVGGEENSAKEVGEAVAAARHLQSVTGATVLLVHHSGKSDKDIERGSSALRANVDCMVYVTMNARRVVTIRNTKQKDHEEFDEIKMRLQQVELDLNGEGERVTSCVLKAPDQTGTHSVGSDLTLSKSAEQALRSLLRVGGESGMSSGNWRKATAGDLGREVSAKTFDNWRGKLVQLGLVEAVPRLRNRYRVSEAGREHANGTPNNKAGHGPNMP